MLHLRRSNLAPFCDICRRPEDADQNVIVQLDVLEEHKANDDEQLPGAKGVDLNSPLDIFHAIFKRVSTTVLHICT